MGLRDLNLATSYHKGINDIAEEFYLPCMGCAMSYDRAVGFFNSTIYTLAWSALKDFVNRGGKIRIICSPILSDDDIKSLEEGYSSRIEQKLAEHFQSEVQKLLSTPSLQKPARVLASLVAMEIIELRIAFLGPSSNPNYKRLFHDKLGIFKDSEANVVTFKGSMNETFMGLANDGNLESVDVYLSWENDREYKRVTNEITYFNLLWDNQYPNTIVKPFPDVARDQLISISDKNNWVEHLNEIIIEITTTLPNQSKEKLGGRTPRLHQKQALKGWTKNNRRGIFEHATGSGKTFTALCAIQESLNKGEVSIVVVPSELLLKQWSNELRDSFSHLELNLLVCGGGHTEWRSKRLLSPWTRQRSKSKPRIVLSTLPTASSQEFLSLINEGKHLFLVVDEVHRVGSLKNRDLLNLDTGPRLGLSATPRRAGDPEGTQIILDYFHGVIPPPFTLKDAIPSALTPYFYYVHTVRLTSEEQEKWDKISKSISRLYAQEKQSKYPDPSFGKRVKLMLIERARIVKAAENKSDIAEKILENQFEAGQKWIVYCDSLLQLEIVTRRLVAKGLPAIEYHSSMTGDKEQTIRVFESNGGIITSIRCLDEGVDIPSVTHALILASSKNPREFIQRRGRVLRKSPGKHLAYIHDVIVLPKKSEENEVGLSIIEAELSRAIEFGKWGENPSSITDLERIALEFGLDLQTLTNYGYEDDND